MKNSVKSFLSIAVLVIGMSAFGMSSASAQASGNVTLTVTLVDVLALTVNNNNVTLTFDSAEDYQDGVSDTKTGQLTVTSNKAYDLKVKANTELINGATSIPVSNVIVQVQNASGMGTTPAKGLSTGDQTIAAGAPAAILRNVDLKYSTAANNTAFLQTQGSYSTTLVYSIAGQ
ncbi:hypothetical protein GCM10027299_58460 [Larkinella ripae]